MKFSKSSDPASELPPPQTTDTHTHLHRKHTHTHTLKHYKKTENAASQRRAIVIFVAQCFYQSLRELAVDESERVLIVLLN